MSKITREEIASVGEFGKDIEYKEGDIVAWRGYGAAILRIKEKDYEFFSNCYVSYHETYNSLDPINLRMATKKEIELLGDEDFLQACDDIYPLDN